METTFKIVISAILISFLVTFHSFISCNSKAHALGYACSYGFFQGCIIERPNGKKILLEQLRYIEDKD